MPSVATRLRACLNHRGVTPQNVQFTPRPLALRGVIETDSNQDLPAGIPARLLKRFLLILSDRIFDSSVDREIPSLAAAPDGPNTCPSLSRSADSIISFSGRKLL